MIPSRSRAERKGPKTVYLDEDELKREHERQVFEKRANRMKSDIQDKQDIISHYENYQLGEGEKPSGGDYNH